VMVLALTCKNSAASTTVKGLSDMSSFVSATSIPLYRHRYSRQGRVHIIAML
jgi:hypothetical protein